MSKLKKNVHGEGNYEAARRYRKSQKNYQQGGDVDRAAREAREAVEGAEEGDLREAEEKGKRRAKKL
jgi:hypothetical protein